MFEKFATVAEKGATCLSRREMLGHCGRGALAMAGLLAGWLAFAGSAQQTIAHRVCALAGAPEAPRFAAPGVLIAG
jgi:hypothetical protein